MGFSIRYSQVPARLLLDLVAFASVSSVVFLHDNTLYSYICALTCKSEFASFPPSLPHHHHTLSLTIVPEIQSLRLPIILNFLQGVKKGVCKEGKFYGRHVFHRFPHGESLDSVPNMLRCIISGDFVKRCVLSFFFFFRFWHKYMYTYRHIFLFQLHCGPVREGGAEERIFFLLKD